MRPSFLQRAFEGRFTSEIAQISRDQLITAAFRGGYPEAIELDGQGRRSWHRAYYAGSVGNASLEAVKHYVQSQGEDMRRKVSFRMPPA